MFDEKLYRTSPVIHRHPLNPILSAKDIPFPATLVFNAGVTKFQGRYVMAFRDDYKYTPDGPTDFESTCIGIATSPDGVSWTVRPKPIFLMGGKEFQRAYDPRLTVIEGRCYMCFAVDTKHGLRGGIAVTDDLERFEILHLTLPDNRNLVLFPEKVGGEYVRLDRPFPVYSRGGGDRFDLWLSRSPDLRFWGKSDLVMGVEDVAFANDKIGPAAPPVKTKHGWLTTFHAVDIDRTRGKRGWEKVWQKRYCAGIMLLDLEDPTKIVGKSEVPLLVPEASYEHDDGYALDVIFPGGMILEDSGEVKIYYGAADTVECLATADVDELVALCMEAK
jgi:beta-1,4-mannooligosaccharide/beta-1,4-mannosyl-N-acetylglucosamine phosphorylase